MLFFLSIYQLYAHPIKQDNSILSDSLCCLLLLICLLAASWIQWYKQGCNDTCSNFKKIPQSWGCSVPKTEIYCPYVLMKLNFKVFRFYLMPDLWDSSYVYRLGLAQQGWFVGYRVPWGKWDKVQMLVNNFGPNIPLWLFFTAGKCNWWSL